MKRIFPKECNNDCIPVQKYDSFHIFCIGAPKWQLSLCVGERGNLLVRRGWCVFHLKNRLFTYHKNAWSRLTPYWSTGFEKRRLLNYAFLGCKIAGDAMPFIHWLKSMVFWLFLHKQSICQNYYFSNFSFIIPNVTKTHTARAPLPGRLSAKHLLRFYSWILR